MAFNADAFLNQTVDAPMSTSVTPCPEGEYVAFIDDGDKAITFSGGRSDKTGDEWNKMNVLFDIKDDAVRDLLKRDKILVPMQCFLDITPAGTLDVSEGKNVSIGRLRQALGQNEGAWNPAMLKGKGPLMVKVTQRSDPKDPTIKYAEIARVAKISA